MMSQLKREMDEGPDPALLMRIERLFRADKDSELLVRVERVAQLRLAISAVTDEPVSGKNATENAASAVALLTTAIIKKTISTIANDDDRFVAGVFVFVFSDYFTLVLPGNFEEACTLALMKVLGIEEFHRSFDTIQESYNELVRSRPKILEGISKACEAWFKNPGASEFERLVELFKIARTHVAQNDIGEGASGKIFRSEE